jgi:ATP-binding cassette subfamily B protein RaxB
MWRFTSRVHTPVIRQDEAGECALACIAMVACAHGYEVDLSVLRQRFPISLKGATLDQVITICEKLGLLTRAVRAEVEELNQIKLPAILHWDLRHFVVLTKIDRRRRSTQYHVHDPAFGQRILSDTQIRQHWTGVALEVSRSQQFKAGVERQTLPLRQLWSSTSGFWQATGNLLILSIFLQLSVLALPLYLQSSVDAVLPSSDASMLKALAVGFGGLAVFQLIFTWIRSVMIVNLSSALSYQISVNVFRHLLRLPFTWFERRHVGDIISRFGSTQSITQLLSSGLISSIVDGLLSVASLILVFIYSPLLGGIALLSQAIYLLVRISYFNALRLRNIDAIGAAAAEQSTFIETVRGMSSIKALANEQERLQLWNAKKISSSNASIKLGQINAGFDSVAAFVISIERILFVYVAISMALGGSLTIGAIFAVQAYKQHFMDAGLRLINQLFNYRISKVHLGRIGDIALSPPEDGGLSQPELQLPYEGNITIRNLTFSYGTASHPTLAHVNFDVRAGSMVALVGPSGGGKSTLMKLMMGLIDPNAGFVSVDGTSLRSCDRRSYRAQIGSVSQDDHLFAGTLIQNISMFSRDPDIDRIKEVCRLVKIHDEIESMPLKYFSLIGDMGSVLSGGQRQRIMLARALYRRPQMLFIDEGTAHLDQESERHIVETLKSMPITKVIIAHRPHFIEASDAIFFVSSGSVQHIERRSKSI